MPAVMPFTWLLCEPPFAVDLDALCHVAANQPLQIVLGAGDRTPHGFKATSTRISPRLPGNEIVRRIEGNG